MKKILNKEMVMSDLGNPKCTIEILKKYEFVFQKRFGQNFLIDSHVLDKIMKAADIREGDFVLEIGPGIGTLTQRLAAAAGKVTAVEIDPALIPILKETLQDFQSVEVVQNDILEVDLEKLAEEKSPGRPMKVVANLPYYITTPILMELLEKKIPIDSITVMVQKEVAKRMCVGPGSKDYGALSLAVQYYAKPSIIASVPPNCFMPRPKVGSTVIQLKIYEKPPVDVQNVRLMFQLIRASFNQRRKTLVNGLLNYERFSFQKEEIQKALEECKFAANVRGESLRLEEFARLSDAFSRQHE